MSEGFFGALLLVGAILMWKAFQISKAPSRLHELSALMNRRAEQLETINPDGAREWESMSNAVQEAQATLARGRFEPGQKRRLLALLLGPTNMQTLIELGLSEFSGTVHRYRSDLYRLHSKVSRLPEARA